MSRTAVVILNYNGEKLMRQFLPSVTQYSSNAEVIVADNGSTDGSLAMLQQEFPQVRTICLPKNYGFCGGYNASLKQVDADYYVLLNSDVAVTPGWLQPMIDLLDADPNVAAVQPKILSYHNQNLFEYAGAGGGFIDAFGYPFCRGRIFDTVEEDHGQYNDSRSIFWATGACMVIRAEVYHEFGGLDEDFFAHMEEIDLCWKIHRTGKKIFYVGASTVYHVGAGTLGYDSPRKTYLNFRNNLALLLKHLNPGEIIWKLPMRFLLDWLAAMVFVLKGKHKNGWAIIEAQGYFLSHLAVNLEKRKALRDKYPRYDRRTIYKGLLIKTYHLGAKKTFTQLEPGNF
ncbi:glycosyltransferase family 2 protein [Pseudochryseolinea flava]|uniref:Glycosyltransferase family 2 protein n=1 Tax=Pseudochryseolinea flava TaxID=2059302 RepID=A0A364Y422_9BACT|nr:glycosyltransferase family 2 protein [Pseudochryseolinea flava]RAW01700.1 glycosyltransferase family 2 protein [Pseudochryseolinea flava]